MSKPIDVVSREFTILNRLTKERFASFQADKADLSFLKAITVRYEEEWRTWHTLVHIADGFTKLRAHYEYFSDPLVIWWAWLYHDVVYVPTANTANELCSAMHAKHELVTLGLPKDFAQAVHDAIVATSDHLVPHDYVWSKQDLAIMLDVDLSGLGSPPQAFQESSAVLRKEVWFKTDKEVRIGVAAFAAKLQTRPHLFQTKHFMHLERPAQENIKQMIGLGEYDTFGL